MVITKKQIIKFTYKILFFFIIFNPPFSKEISFTTIVVVISAIYCFSKFKRILAITKIETFIRNYNIFFTYACIGVLINLLFREMQKELIGNYVNLLISNVSIILVSIMLAFTFFDKFGDIDDVIDVYIGAGTLQGIIGFMCFLSPSIKSRLNTMMINGSTGKIANSVLYTSSYRNYGFASSLYDIFGFSMSLLTILAIYQVLKGKKKYFLNVFFIGVTAILNARTSFVMIAIGLIFLLFFSGESMNKKWKNTLIISFIFIPIIIIIIMGGGGSKLSGGASDSSKWLLTGLNEIKMFIFNRQSIGYFAALEEFIFFPNNIFDLLFGTGMTPQQIVLVNSDVGYIQNIWQFGIIGSFIEYYVIICLFIDVRKIANNLLKALLNCDLLLIAIYLLKLDCLGYSMASVIYLPIMLFLIVLSYKKET